LGGGESLEERQAREGEAGEAHTQGVCARCCVCVVWCGVCVCVCVCVCKVV